MKIEQFENKELAHFSYAMLSEPDKKVVLIDPGRDPQPYYSFASQHDAEIEAIVETHPHADFVSSHLEMSKKTGAPIYVSALAEPKYDHVSFDPMTILTFNEFSLRALDTPGHSPDSISVVLQQNEVDYAVFTGDTLFIGDCGRPDLREKAGTHTETRESLARAMYTSLRDVLGSLEDSVIVYPAHGAGSLCGKSLKDAKSSTIGAEKATNWSMQEMSPDEFVAHLLADQPFVPAYFGFDVEANLEGAPALADSLSQVRVTPQPPLAAGNPIVIIDTRDEKLFRHQHRPNSINIMANGAFETWLGTLVKPHQPFYLTAVDTVTLTSLILRAASIGYEGFIQGAFVFEEGQLSKPVLDLDALRQHSGQFTIVDVRNHAEVRAHKIFPESIHIPLPELADRWREIPLNRPIAVHCAGGYRSAAASSLLETKLKDRALIYDISDAIKEF